MSVQETLSEQAPQEKPELVETIGEKLVAGEPKKKASTGGPKLTPKSFMRMHGGEPCMATWRKQIDARFRERRGGGRGGRR